MAKDKRFSGLPVIETERLLLRALEMRDAKDIFEWVSDPQVTAFLFWRAHQSIEDSRDFISWVTTDDFACWGVVLTENSKVIGNCFLHNVNFEHKRAEIAFNIARKYWGRGYATETAQAIIQFGFGYWQLNRIEGTCMVENRASSRVMEKAGMTLEGVLRKYVYAQRTVSRYEVVLDFEIRIARDKKEIADEYKSTLLW